MARLRDQSIMQTTNHYQPLLLVANRARLFAEHAVRRLNVCALVRFRGRLFMCPRCPPCFPSSQCLSTRTVWTLPVQMSMHFEFTNQCICGSTIGNSFSARKALTDQLRPRPL